MKFPDNWLEAGGSGAWITWEENLALERYARDHGRHRWKTALRADWANGTLPNNEDRSTLQELRNKSGFGPRGLVQYRIRDLLKLKEGE